MPVSYVFWNWPNLIINNILYYYDFLDVGDLTAVFGCFYNT